MNVAVLGAAGFVGGELLAILLAHPEVEDVLAVSRSRAGRPIREAHPGLTAMTDADFSDEVPAGAARGRDAVFLALEHGASSAVLDEILAADPGLVVDLSADHRIADPELHARHYGARPGPPPARPFRYALADVEGSALRGARALAVPGCFATAAQIALWPPARSDAPFLSPPTLFAITGSSGGGRTPRPGAHHPARAHNVFAYGIFSHRHEAEILEQWRSWTGHANGAGPRLVVHAGPFVRGIHLTLHARFDGGAARAAAAYRDAYADRPFVRVIDRAPELAWSVGTNLAFVHATASADDTELQTMVAIDNLVKGAAGQAVQAANLALGLPEDAGLRLAGTGPW